MRTLLLAFSLVLLHAHFFCSSGHHDDVNHLTPVADVTVTITGDAGTGFAAHFEDDRGAQEAAGVVPFTADFDDQVTFFTAVLDKEALGHQLVCIRVTTPLETRESCTRSPNGRTTITIVF